jgi:hypothetical protein
MRYFPRGTHFVKESFARFLVAGKGLRKKFQRYGLLQDHVGDPVDFAHTAATEQIDHSISAR